MDTQQSPQQEQSQQNTKQNKGKVFIPLAVLILLFLGGYALSQNRNKDARVNNEQVGVSQEQKAAQVPEGERQELETKARALEGQIKGFTAQTSSGDQYRAYLQLSALKHRLGLYDEAIAALDKIPADNSGTPRIFIAYALIYKDKGDLAKTAENAKKALDLDQENPQYWVVYLEAEQGMGNADREVKYKEALQKTENSTEVLVSYAKFLEKIGNKAGAREQYIKLTVTDPSNADKYNAEIERLKK
jgi:tetratricopeptide (TPR) repeat protein